MYDFQVLAIGVDDAYLMVCRRKKYKIDKKASFTTFRSTAGNNFEKRK